jgi:hypothetical protein
MCERRLHTSSLARRWLQIDEFGGPSESSSQSDSARSGKNIDSGKHLDIGFASAQQTYDSIVATGEMVELNPNCTIRAAEVWTIRVA